VAALPGRRDGLIIFDDEAVQGPWSIRCSFLAMASASCTTHIEGVEALNSTRRPIQRRLTVNTNTSKLLRILSAGWILSVAALDSVTVSHAADAAAPPQVTVKFADLDLSTSSGAAALYGRIHSAADEVCLRTYVTDRAYRWHRYACLQKVIGDAVIEVNSPGLFAVFSSKYGAAAPVLLAAAR
jgi:UrcA family protein